MRPDCRRTAALAAVALACAGAARAQFVQYTAPGSLAQEQIPTRELVKNAMDAAPYHVGTLRFGPWFALKDVAYVSNAFATPTDEKSDVTATVGAGLHAYLPLARRLTLGMYALPEYVWWRDLANRRGWNGAVGAGLFGYFNRMTVEVRAGGSREQRYPSSEVEVPVNLEARRVSALVEVPVAGQLSVFARGGVDRWRYNQRGLTSDLASRLAGLDRDEKYAGGGVRLHFTRTISLGLGAERYTTDFVNAGSTRANSGLAPIAELALETGRLRVDASAAALDLTPRGASGFVPYKGTNGSFRVGVKPAGRLELDWYGGRNLAYSIEPGTSYYLDERTGLAVQSALGWRATARVFAETGRNRYVGEAVAAARRSDDLRAYGALVSVQLGRLTTLTAGGDRTDYTSNVVGFDRSVTRVQTSLQFATGKAQWW